MTKYCVEIDCKKHANFGPIGGKPLYCLAHREDNMIDVKNKKCISEGCGTQPNYNFKGEKKTLYCSAHKEDGMIDIKNKKCVSEGCGTRSAFNFKREKKTLYCSAHKEDGMVDITHKKCISEGCETCPNYNFKGQKKATHCLAHKEDNMIDVLHKLCSLCNYTRANYNGYCSPCFYQLNPEHVKSKRHKTRENAFMMPLKERYPTIILDKTIECGCSRKRPDGLIDLYTHSIIVEIDEDQHQGYSCENKRAMQLFQDLGSRPLIFIRLNPDKYSIDGKRQSSAFSLSKTTGTLQIKQKEFDLRYQKLIETIDEAHLQPDKEITTIELFYDC